MKQTQLQILPGNMMKCGNVGAYLWNTYTSKDSDNVYELNPHAVVLVLSKLRRHVVDDTVDDRIIVMSELRIGWIWSDMLRHV